ncbi:MAG: hypothetical protein WAN51_01715 [Alphaproteobacteria bacterium]
MSTMSTLLNRSPKAPQAPKASEVLRKLEQAEATLADLEAQHGQLALDALAGVDGATKALADAEAKLSEARTKVANLHAAHRTAIANDEAAERARVTAIQKTQLNAVKSHLAARDNAAEELATALEAAGKAWRTLLQRSGQAQEACPIRTEFPLGGLCGLGDLRRIVEREMFRVAGDGSMNNAASLPGAHWGCDINLQHNPDAVPPLVDEIKRASAFVIGKLKEQVAK